MGKKIILLLLLILLFVPLISSAPSVAKINQPYQIIRDCEGYTCSSLNITIFFPNSSLFIVNGTMTNNLGYANYSVTPPVFGDYIYVFFDGSNTTTNSFKATSNGFDLDTQGSLVYLSYFIMLIFFFSITILGIGKLPANNTKDEEGVILQVSYLKYLRLPLWFFSWIFLIGILFLASNLGFAYLGETLFANIFFILFRITLSITPLFFILWVLKLVAMIIEDKKIKEAWSRGMLFSRK